MRTVALLAAIAVAVHADRPVPDFPKDDDDHAYCHVAAFYPKQNCMELQVKMSFEIANWWTAETSPAGGAYSIHSSSAPYYIWSKRTTRDEQYVDDQLFDFE